MVSRDGIKATIWGKTTPLYSIVIILVAWLGWVHNVDHPPHPFKEQKMEFLGLRYFCLMKLDIIGISLMTMSLHLP